ncbi:MAG TPA: hypothetical protein VMK84_00180 [Streptosporangiaceae bacterium]|nr:hypothetical protein [Streptosporangiaceae bacterium]
MTGNLTLRQALTCARRGWPVFPCAGKHEIRLHDHGRAEHCGQCRCAQRLRRPCLARRAAHPVEWHPDHVDLRLARRVPGGRRCPHHVLPGHSGRLEISGRLFCPTPTEPASAQLRLTEVQILDLLILSAQVVFELSGGPRK